MFDWDRDYASEVAPRRLPAGEAEPAAAPEGHAAGRAPRRPGGKLATIAGLAALLAAGAWFMPRDTPRMDATLAAFGGPVSGISLFLPDEDAMPSGLLAYERAEYDSFRQGLRLFGDHDLVEYAGTMRRMLRDLSAPLAPHLADALLVTEAEKIRRGLSVTPSAPELHRFRAARGATIPVTDALR